MSGSGEIGGVEHGDDGVDIHACRIAHHRFWSSAGGCWCLGGNRPTSVILPVEARARERFIGQGGDLMGKLRHLAQGCFQRLWVVGLFDERGHCAARRLGLAA